MTLAHEAVFSVRGTMDGQHFRRDLRLQSVPPGQ